MTPECGWSISACSAASNDNQLRRSLPHQTDASCSSYCAVHVTPTKLTRRANPTAGIRVAATTPPLDRTNAAENRRRVSAMHCNCANVCDSDQDRTSSVKLHTDLPAVPFSGIRPVAPRDGGPAPVPIATPPVATAVCIPAPQLAPGRLRSSRQRACPLAAPSTARLIRGGAGSVAVTSASCDGDTTV